MDIQDFWDDNKRWILGVLLGVVAFFVARSMVRYDGSEAAARLSQARREIGKGDRFGPAAVADAGAAQDALQAEMDRLLRALAFEPAAAFSMKGKDDPVQVLNAQQLVLQHLEDQAAEHGVELERRNVQWNTPVTPDERRSFMLGLALMDESMARLFAAHRRVVEADPTARGLAAIRSLRIGSGRAGMGRSRRRSADDASQYLEEEVLTFQIEADAATTAAWLEACKGGGNPMSMLDLNMSGSQRIGEPVTVKGELAAVTFDRERFEEDLAAAELEERN